ncbi:lysophospholipid acyltransferase family protein [Treponema sp. J25]|uniref:lysophospholipid acyltransferase family protein n=1 Tax=Treponema sp. J25 TaxID=2094121 RepID=UPI00104CCFAA|nr:lysophospholipid acyltransferase family protein [Treponema sp. J25]TCW60700.1 1-acyl-sn-glycerol-3-phosphate acyltransferase [Treponema sp. J25]
MGNRSSRKLRQRSLPFPLQSPIEGDSYHTPEGIPRALREYFLLGSRWSPYSFFIASVLRYRTFALEGRYSHELFAHSSLELMHNLERCGARFSIQGLDHLRRVPGPLVLVANHMSTLETTLLPGLITPIKPVTFVVKESLLRGFFWGPIMRSRDPIPVTRRDPRQDLETVLNEGVKRLQEGISIIIFPQGTRSEVFDPRSFNSLGVKLASRAGVPLMPVALKTDFWGNGKVFRPFGAVHRDRIIHIALGEALPVSGRGKAEHEACLAFITGRLKEWGASIVVE